MLPVKEIKGIVFEKFILKTKQFSKKLCSILDEISLYQSAKYIAL